MSSPSTSAIADVLHDAGEDDRFTLTISGDGPSPTFRWRGCSRQIRCVLDLLAARLTLADLNGDDTGGPDDGSG